MSMVSRRRFLGSAAAATGASLAPAILSAENKGDSVLRVAAIGCAGRGWDDIREIAPGNRMVALCDVDASKMAQAAAAFPEARKFSDYREMFATMADQIDVVTVSTPDHMHFPIAMESLRRGKPVMVQKPLCNMIGESRQLAAFAKEQKILTVMGNQGATTAGTRALREWLDAGLIGEVKEVHYWTNRPIWPQGKNLALNAAPVPESLDWKLWQGTVATDRPYSPDLHPFKWRGYWDYGCGALGDIGCHSFNSAFWAMDLTGDFVVEASKVSPFDMVTAPARTTIVYHFPAKDKRGPVKITWQDGVADPNSDAEFVRPPGIPADLRLSQQYGQVFVGTEGALYVSDATCSSMPEIFPVSLREKSRKVEKQFPQVSGGPTQELCRAVRGEGPKPVSNFEDHAGPLTELVLAGNLAVRCGKRIDWDSAGMLARGNPDIAPFLTRTYRAGWEP